LTANRGRRLRLDLLYDSFVTQASRLAKQVGKAVGSGRNARLAAGSGLSMAHLNQ
jgi:hypothetical protein